MYRTTLLTALLLLVSTSITSPAIERRGSGFIMANGGRKPPGPGNVQNPYAQQQAAQQRAALVSSAAAAAIEASAASAAAVKASITSAAAIEASAASAAAVEASITSAAVLASQAAVEASIASLVSVTSASSASAFMVLLSDTEVYDYGDPDFQASQSSAAAANAISTSSVVAYERLAGVTATPSTTACEIVTVDGSPQTVTCSELNFKWRWGNGNS